MSNGNDVVLVDTAGRMQDNEPLMRALAKLVSTVRPEQVLFVGEALAGNEAVDQVTKFSKALVDFSTDAAPIGVSGVFLSKFDTVSDKVGAAVSLCHASGLPLVFVGVGQHYHSMKALKPKQIVAALMQ